MAAEVGANMPRRRSTKGPDAVNVVLRSGAVFDASVHGELTRAVELLGQLASNLAEPLLLSDGGLSPFVAEVWTDLAKKKLPYTCAINFQWLDLRWRACEVPIRARTVKQYMECYFRKPSHLPTPVVVSFRHQDNPVQTKTAWRSLTPEEMLYGMVFAIARDIDAEDEGAVKEWNRILLSTPARLVVVENPQAEYFAAVQQREDLCTTFNVVRRTVLQRVLEVAHFRDVWMPQKSACTPKQIFKMYSDHVTAQEVVNTGHQAITESFVDVAFTIYNRMVAVPKIMDVLRKLDEFETNSVSDSMYKLQWIISKAREESLITVTMEYLLYMTEKGTVPYDNQVSVAKIKGSAGQAGLVDVVLFRMGTVREGLITKTATTHGVRSHVVSKMQQVFADVASFKAAPATWKDGFAPAELKYTAFVEVATAVRLDSF